MKRKEIVILHEYGNSKHFRGLKHLLKYKYNNRIELKYREFSILKKIVKALISRDFKTLEKQFTNILSLLRLFFSKDKIIILGIAPYDWRMLVLKEVLRNHSVFYFTSWPYWDFSFYPKKTFAKNRLVKVAWKNFLEKDVRGFFTVTKTACMNLKNNYEIDRPCSVVYHSYNPDIYFPGKRFFQDDSTGKKINCLFVGRLCKEKGVDRILKVVELLPKNGFRFKFVGEGPLRNNILNVSRKYNSVIYCGFVNNEKKLADIYRDSDILLLPSRRTKNWEELFGMVIIEAMACGNIVISTNHVGPKELIRNGYNGFYFSEDRYVEKTVGVLMKLANDLSLLKTLKRNAVKFSKTFSKEEIAKKWDRILEGYLQ